MPVPPLVCSTCRRASDLGERAWRCPACGGLFDLGDVPPSFPADTPEWWTITLGEGGTPLIAQPGGPWLKLDYAMPTLSFKDRGAATLVSALATAGARRLIADSSGNAGTSIAAYAARAGLACDVYVPASASPKKLAAARAHGATVHAIDGTRADVALAAQEAVDRGDAGTHYASHVYNPWFFHGVRTFALEVCEQLGRAPDAVVLPVGNGTYLLGAARGFAELVATGLADRVPRLVAVRAERAVSGTVAEGIAIPEPPRAAQIDAAVAASGGRALTVSDDEILAAQHDLAAGGLWVEPTAAVPYAAWQRERATLPDLVVVPLGGAGLKAG